MIVIPSLKLSRIQIWRTALLGMEPLEYNVEDVRSRIDMVNTLILEFWNSDMS